MHKPTHPNRYRYRDRYRRHWTSTLQAAQGRTALPWIGSTSHRLPTCPEPVEGPHLPPTVRRSRPFPASTSPIFNLPAKRGTKNQERRTRLATLPTPTGFCPKAKGWPQAYPGTKDPSSPNPEGVVPIHMECKFLVPRSSFLVPRSGWTVGSPGSPRFRSVATSRPSPGIRFDFDGDFDLLRHLPFASSIAIAFGTRYFRRRRDAPPYLCLRASVSICVHQWLGQGNCEQASVNIHRRPRRHLCALCALSWQKYFCSCPAIPAAKELREHKREGVTVKSVHSPLLRKTALLFLRSLRSFAAKNAPIRG